MLMKTIQHDKEGIHVDYYETTHHKEGHIDLKFTDPALITHVKPDDTIRIFGLSKQAETTHNMKVLLVHRDGSKELLPCIAI